MSSSRDHRRQLYERLVGQPVASGRFVITKLLGFGGMGAVYEAVQKNMNRKVALKLIPTHDPTIVARFEREALTISKLQHPNTITVFDFGQSEDGFLFLSMELLEGKTLTDVIEAGPLEPDRAVHVATQICRSLAEAHRAGIVHRDVKPDNIILITVDDDPDVVKVLDFGIAKAVMGEDDVQLTGDGRIIGTPRYMSPEQILAEPLDHRSDIYSLGCILFEMLCGGPPFQQSSTTALMISHTQDPPPAFAQQLDPGAMSRMPPGLERVVRRALSKHPKDRHQSCDELREDLESALKGTLAPGYDDSDGFETAAALPPLDVSTTGSGLKAPPEATLPPSGATMETPSSGGGTAKVLIVGIIALVVFIVGLLALAALRDGTPTTEPAPVTAAEPPEPKPEPKAEPEIVAEPIAPEKEKKSQIVHIIINTKPEGAKVYEGESFLGRAPVSVPVKAELKNHEYRLVRDGYEELPVSIPVTPENAGAKVEKWFELEEKKVAARPNRSPRRPKPQPQTGDDPKPTGPVIPIIEDKPKASVPIIK